MSPNIRRNGLPGCLCGWLTCKNRGVNSKWCLPEGIRLQTLKIQMAFRYEAKRKTMGTYTNAHIHDVYQTYPKWNFSKHISQKSEWRSYVIEIMGKGKINEGKREQKCRVQHGCHNFNSSFPIHQPSIMIQDSSVGFTPRSSLNRSRGLTQEISPRTPD